MLVCTDKIRECHNLGDQNVKVISYFFYYGNTVVIQGLNLHMQHL